MAIGKFHGVIRPTTPTGSRVTSTPTPGRTEGTHVAAGAQRLAGEELEDVAGARDLADGLGQGLAFFARQQVAELVARAPGSRLPAASRMSKRCCGVDRPQARLRLRGGGDGRARLRGIGLRVLADHVARVRRVDVARGAGAVRPTRR